MHRGEKLLSYKAASTTRARASKIAPEGRGSRCLVRPIGARFRITFKRLRRARTISVENVAYSGLSISRSAGRSHASPYPLPASVPCSLQGRGIPSPDESALRVIRVTGTCRPGDGALPPSSGITSHQPLRPPTHVHSPGSTGAKGAGRLNGSHNKSGMEKPERVASAFRSRHSLRLCSDGVERTLGPGPARRARPRPPVPVLLK